MGVPRNRPDPAVAPVHPRAVQRRRRVGSIPPSSWDTDAAGWEGGPEQGSSVSALPGISYAKVPGTSLFLATL